MPLVFAQGTHTSDIRPLGPVTSICATHAYRITDRQIDRCYIMWWALLTDKSAKLKNILRADNVHFKPKTKFITKN